MWKCLLFLTIRNESETWNLQKVYAKLLVFWLSDSSDSAYILLIKESDSQKVRNLRDPTYFDTSIVVRRSRRAGQVPVCQCQAAALHTAPVVLAPRDQSWRWRQAQRGTTDLWIYGENPPLSDSDGGRFLRTFDSSTIRGRQQAFLIVSDSAEWTCLLFLTNKPTTNLKLQKVQAKFQVSDCFWPEYV